MASNKKLTKRKALILIKDYFEFSERSRKIGAMEIEVELSYQEKVAIQNHCYQHILRISDELANFDIYSIRLR